MENRVQVQAKAQATAKKKAKESLDLLLAYRNVFGTAQAEKVVNDLIKRYMLRSSMDDSPNRLAFHEGERNVVLFILTMLNIDEDKLRERVNNVKDA
jgi:hypothetical protein